MKKRFLINKIITGVLTFLIMKAAQAGIPLWVFAPLTSTKISVPKNGNATIQYQVRNQSRKTHTLVMTPIRGISQVTTPGNCPNPFTLAYQQSCKLTLTITGNALQDNVIGGPKVCQQGNLLQCYQPSRKNSLNITKEATDNPTNTTLTTSVSDLALSVTGLTEYGVPQTPSSGRARIITITNIGSSTAVNLSVTTPTWPQNTQSSTTCGSTLTRNKTCTITVTPGDTATTDNTNPCSTTGTAPVPGVVQVTADNANTVSINVVVLSYGCIYQGGYVYALDDTTENNGSVGGKVATTSDQSNGVIWSSDSLGGFDGGVPIYGISEISTPTSPNPTGGQVSGQVACDGNENGACNTNNIYTYYQNNAAGAPINLSFYAAGLCKQPISGFSDWYLPANCEMGYGSESACGSSSAPTLQNMQSNLVDFNALNLLAGEYWSSTEFSVVPQFGAGHQFFASSGNFQNFAFKAGVFGVRCSRAF